MTRNQLAYHTLQETIRSNKANEGIKTDQHLETARHNLVSESHTSEQNKIQAGLAKSQQFKNYVSGVSGAIKDVAGAASSLMGIPQVNIGGSKHTTLDPQAQIQQGLNRLNYRDVRMGSLFSPI